MPKPFNELENKEINSTSAVKNETTLPSRSNRSLIKELRLFAAALTTNHYFALLLICLTGTILLTIANGMEETNLFHHIFRDTGIALFPIGIMSLIYEVVLRNNFLINMSNTIKEQMPSRYSNMREAGLIDVYKELNIDKLKDTIQDVERCEIRILDIWMENLHRLEPVLYDSVAKRNCKVKILLYHPKEILALKKRSQSLLGKISFDNIIQHILENLELILHIINRLKKEGLYNQENFDIKLYTGFISISLISYGSEMLVSNYLRSDISSMTPQLKISGEQHYWYKVLNNHFFSLWDDNTNVSFNEEVYNQLQEWNVSRIIGSKKKPNEDIIDNSNYSN